MKRGRSALTRLSNNSDNLASLRSEKAEQVEALWKLHPELRRVEEALFHELTMFTATSTRSGNAVSPADNVAFEKRIAGLRQERVQLLRHLNLADDYAQADYACPLCRDIRFVPLGDSWVPCTCQIERNKVLQRQQSGITARMTGQTFDSFSLEYYAEEKRGDATESAYQRAEKALSGCKRFVEEVVNGRSQYGLYLYGDPGVGKTHLVAAAANALIERGVGVRYRVTAGLLNSIRATYDESDEMNRVRESDIIDELSRIPVLILDDIGVERFTPWVVEKFYQIINYRYLNDLPTVLTSNYPLDVMMEEMGEGGTAARIASRIAESCRVYWLIGVDIRFWKR